MALEISHPLRVETPVEFIQEAGLSHTGFTDNTHHMTRAFSHLLQKGLQRRELSHAAHVRSQGVFLTPAQFRAPLLPAYDAIKPDLERCGPRLGALLSRGTRRQPRHSPHQAARGLAHQNLADLR